MLGERVREAVENLIRGHGEALSALAGVPEAGLAGYRAYLEDFAGTSSAEAPSDDDETFPGAARRTSTAPHAGLRCGSW